MRLIQILINFMMGGLFSTGLVLAGSDGDWFPWANLAGLFLFLLFVCLANRLRPVPWR